MTAIKICDVRTPEIARACADLGVDLIGLHCIWDPPDPSKARRFREIRKAVESQVFCVLVTRQTNVQTVVEMAKSMPWFAIQLHAKWLAPDVAELRSELNRIGECPQLIGAVQTGSDDVRRLGELKRVVDYVLLDTSLIGGSGQLSTPDGIALALQELNDFPTLIAGGLTPENVKRILKFNPWGVDVQSGVERPDGSREKDITLIRRFVDAVRSPMG